MRNHKCNFQSWCSVTAQFKFNPIYKMLSMAAMGSATRKTWKTYKFFTGSQYLNQKGFSLHFVSPGMMDDCWNDIRQKHSDQKWHLLFREQNYPEKKSNAHGTEIGKKPRALLWSVPEKKTSFSQFRQCSTVRLFRESGRQQGNSNRGGFLQLT